MATIFDMRINYRLVSLKQRYRQVKKIKSKPSPRQSRFLFLGGKEKEKFEEQGVQTPAVTEGFRVSIRQRVFA